MATSQGDANRRSGTCLRLISRIFSISQAGLASGVSCKTFSKAPSLKNSKLANKVFVIGFDGMDPVLLRKFAARGEMPNRIVSGGKGTAQGKMDALSAAGVKVGLNPTEAGELMADIVAGL